MTRLSALLILAAAIFAGVMTLGSGAIAQGEQAFSSAQEASTALAKARAEGKAAEARGIKLEKEAREATQAAEKTANEAAALAARIQQAEAGSAAAEARIALIDNQRAALQKRLADRREPLVRLTAALQRLARRPVALSALRPGSLRETVYMRAMLESTIPQVRIRTAALRAEVERGRRLEAEAQQALASLQASERALDERRASLAAIESRQRIESRRASGDAARETDRALALAEEALDLDSLVSKFEREGSLRQELAALPGPVLRPASPARSQVSGSTPSSETSASPTRSPARAGRIAGFQLPVTGRTLSGFGEQGEGGTRNSGLTIAPREGAQVVAPAAGRVAFAGPYRGFGAIVIVEHSGGFTSLVTGLARTDVEVGETLVAGAPLGVAEVERPSVMIELRRGGTLVNPLDFVE